ncbi:ribonuclease H-like YkuK family protein [Candidatus Curtissbacteria bacterium]|nr:ribonuclease H-like YkuK family protein [Candidatus Curtissbacteria bacterium]
MKGKLVPESFNSPTYGHLDWEDALCQMVKFVGSDVMGSYEVIIGTDSEAQNGTVDFVSAVIVHKKGKGGIYFWGRQKVENLHSLRQRIWQEALISLSVAEKLVSDFANIGLFDGSTHSINTQVFDSEVPQTRGGRTEWNRSTTSLTINPEQRRRADLNLEIHVDIGPNGPTREMISEIVGMIRANGFKVATKPASWGASHVADRHV